MPKPWDDIRQMRESHAELLDDAVLRIMRVIGVGVVSLNTVYQLLPQAVASESQVQESLSRLIIRQAVERASGGYRLRIRRDAEGRYGIEDVGPFTRPIRQLMADGVTRSVSDIATKTGLPVHVVGAAMTADSDYVAMSGFPGGEVGWRLSEGTSGGPLDERPTMLDRLLGDDN